MPPQQTVADKIVAKSTLTRVSYFPLKISNCPTENELNDKCGCHKKKLDSILVTNGSFF